MSKFIAVNQLQNATAEILIYGDIGYDVVSGDFVRELKMLEVANTTINVRINSGGGNIFEGLAIFNAILQSKANVYGYIDGIAASMASVIAMACKKVYMSKYAMFMTHKASGAMAGGADSMRNYAHLIDSLENTICNIYATKTGLTADEAKAKYLDNGDRWITAQEAAAEKIIDGIYDGVATEMPPATMRNEKALVMFYQPFIEPLLKIDNQMIKISLTAEQAMKLSLKTDADQSAIATAIDALIAKADKVDSLTAKLQTAETAKTKAEADLATIQNSTVTAKVTALLDVALNTDKRITAKLKEKLAVDYATNPEGLEAVLEAMPKFSSITGALDSNDAAQVKLAAKSWDELDKEGLLEGLKANHIDLFKQKFQEKFKTEYQGK